MRKTLLILLVSIFTTAVHGSGLDLTMFYGSRQIGLGGQQIAIATDGYAPFYNPAAMMGVENGAVATGFSPLFIQYEAPMGIAATKRKSEMNIAPIFYLGGVYRINDLFVAGMALYPTALQGGKIKNIDYSDDITDKEWSLRMVRFEAAPSLSFQPDEHFSVGVSWRMGYTNVRHRFGVFAGPSGAYIKTNNKAWDFKGLKFGAHLNDVNGWNVGMTYRIANRIKLKGKTAIEDDGLGLLGGAPSASGIPTSLTVDIPPQLQVGVSKEWIPDTFMTAFSWEYTWNSDVERLTYNNRTTGAAIANAETQWNDANTLHLGAEYTFHLSGDRRVRTNAGFAFDQQTTHADFPNPVGPSANHYYGTALGVQYLWANYQVGIAGDYGTYSRKSDRTPAGNATFPGKYKTTAYQAVADFTWAF